MQDIILWWHWIVFGIALLIAEIFTGTFFILGLGVAALIVGLFSFLFIITFNTELLLWIILCLLAISLWFKFIKGRSISQSGQSNYRLDTTGVVTKEIKPNTRGEVLFNFPVLGNTKWVAISKENIKKGEEIKIVRINGELLEVQKIKEE